MLGARKESASKKVSTDNKTVRGLMKTGSGSREVTGVTKTVMSETRGSVTTGSSNNRFIGKSTKVSIGSDGSVISKSKYLMDSTPKRKSDPRSFMTTSCTLVKKDTKSDKQTSSTSVPEEIDDVYCDSEANGHGGVLTTASQGYKGDYHNHEDQQMVHVGRHETTESLSKSSSSIQKTSSFSSSRIVTGVVNTVEHNEGRVRVDENVSPDGRKRIRTTLYQLEPAMEASHLSEESVHSEQVSTFTSHVENKENISSNRTFNTSSSLRLYDDSRKALQFVDIVDDAKFISDEHALSSMTTNDSFKKFKNVTTFEESNSNMSADTAFDSPADTVIIKQDALDKSTSERKSKKQDVDVKIYKGPVKEQCICEICTCG
ncbi:hypothetical protein RUM43_014580 [Polyplax serrata]|uniref:Uncharacterized protein n=1 Tax=Polyplax serrata TaxID=468196 RepID=A0AAN8S3J1_POLSC